MIAEELKLVIKAEVDKAVRDIRQFQGVTDHAKDSTGKLEQSFQSLVKTLAVVGISAVALKKAWGFLLDAGQLASQVSQIETSFANIADSAGISADKLLTSLREASKGAVSTVNLMKGASRANLFGLPMDQLSRLMEIARASSLATGESVEFMFQSIVTGIGRSSPMILDNLGIVVKLGEANQEYADALGKTVEQLTVAEQKQALLNEVLRAGAETLKKVGDTALTDAERWQRLTAAMTDMRVAIGKDFMDSARPFLDWLIKVVENSNEASKNMKAFAEAQKTMAAGGAMFNVASAAEGAAAQRKQLEETRAALKSGRLGMVEGTEETIKAIDKQIESLDRQIYQMALIANAQEQQKKAARDLVKLESDRAEAAERYKAAVESRRMELNLRDNYEMADAQYLIEQATDAANKALERQREYLNTRDWYEAADAQYIFAGAMKETAVVSDEFVRSYSTFMQQLERGRGLMGEQKAAVVELKEELLDIADVLASGLGAAFESIGTMLVDSEEGLRDFLRAIANTIATMLEMIGKELLIDALADIMKLTIDPIGSLAAAAAAFAAAGVVRAMANKGMAEGGIVTKPTRALIGEAGPEAVIPLSKMGALGTTIVVNVSGNVITKEELFTEIAKHQARNARAW